MQTKAPVLMLIVKNKPQRPPETEQSICTNQLPIYTMALCACVMFFCLFNLWLFQNSESLSSNQWRTYILVAWSYWALLHKDVYSGHRSPLLGYFNVNNIYINVYILSHPYWDKNKEQQRVSCTCILLNCSPSCCYADITGTIQYQQDKFHFSTTNAFFFLY